MTPPRVVTVSPAQYDVIRELAHDGPSNAAIAERLGKTKRAVAVTLCRVMAKAEQPNRTALALALDRGRLKVQVRDRRRTA